MTDSLRARRIVMPQPPGTGRVSRSSTAMPAAMPQSVRRNRRTQAAGAAAASPPASTRTLAPGRVVRGPQRERHEPDYLILVSIVALAAVGILMIYSSSGLRSALRADGDLWGAIAPQLAWSILGLVVLLVLTRVDYRYLRLASVPAYLVAIALLVSVMLPENGLFHPQSYGQSARWLQIGSLPAMHPAEFAKLALIVYLAHWLAKRGGQISSLVHGLVPFLVIAGPIILLVAIEPDLGTTGVITLSAVTMLFVAGASLWQMLLMAPVGFAALVTYISGKGYQQDRLAVFVDPWKYATGDGYQTVHGLLALAMGGIFGIGLGQSSQPGGLFVPNSDNDFIFAIVGQELGLVGAVAVVGLYLFFAYRGVKVALGAPDTFGALLAVGITAWLTIQAFINIGVVLLIIPNTGITLPFISSGGSSLVVSFAAVGILLSISRETQSRGTWNDADPDRGRGYGRPHLPRTGRPERTRRTAR
jgi:cell division protein FtsW